MHEHIRVDDHTHIAMTVFQPEDLTGAQPQPVLFLFPGGGFTRHYFDIRLGTDQSYSQGSWHAERSVLTIAFDHLGTGDSTPSSPSRVQLEQAHHHAVRQILERLQRGVLLPNLPPISKPIAIGAGHSVGGHVVISMQAAYFSFDVVAVFGASMTWTRLRLQEGARQPFRALPNESFLISATAYVDWVANDHWDDVPAWLVERDTDRRALPPWRSRNVPAFASELLEPFASARQAANVRVPVLLVYGQQDVTVEPLEDAAVFRSAPAVAVMVVPRMGHIHNLASTRRIAWTRLQTFITEAVALHQLENRTADTAFAWDSSSGPLTDS